MNQPVPAAGHPQRWLILAVMCLSLILVVAGVSSLNLALPSIRNALQPSNTELLWIVDAYALVFAGLLLPAGALGDRFGRRRALLIGLTLFATGLRTHHWYDERFGEAYPRNRRAVIPFLI